jgi:tetratricopeptide (TPR) repeat protein
VIAPGMSGDLLIMAGLAPGIRGEKACGSKEADPEIQHYNWDVLVVILSFLALFFAGGDELARVEEMLAAGDHPGALARLESAGAQPERSARWHWLASRAYDGLDNPAKAVEHAEAGLAIDPANETLHLQLGQIFLSRNTPLAAFEIFDEALRARPGSLLLLLGKGLALKEMQRYEEAEEALLESLNRNPGLSIAFDALGTVYLHTKRYEDLQKLAAECQSRDPREGRAYYYLAAAHNGLHGASEKPEELLREGIRLNPRFAASHALLGKVLLDSGRHEDAIEPLETAIRLRPDYSPAYMHLAMALRKAGREKEAGEMLRKFQKVKEKEGQPAPALHYSRGKR